MSALAALEVERGPFRRMGQRGGRRVGFIRAMLDGSMTNTDDIVARAGEVGCDLSRGGGV